MKKKMWLLGATALVLGLLAVLTDGGYVAADDQKPTPADEVMKKLHGKTGTRTALKAVLKANPVEWEKVQTYSKTYVELAEALGKNDPPKGEKSSWEKLTKAFADTAKEMHAKAEKKDAAGTLAELNKIGGMCMPCHTAHRGG